MGNLITITASMIEEDLEEEQEEKPIIENGQEPMENVYTNDANLTKSTEEEMGKELGTYTNMDLPCHRKLPVELNCQIYLCFNPATQRKFIYGLGWDFYAMFRHKLLTKTKRVCNPGQNFWNRATSDAIISKDGLGASRNSITGRSTAIYAEKGFAISGKHSRVDSFPGTIIYYYEVKLLSEDWCLIGFSDGTPKDEWFGDYPNSYAMSIEMGYHYEWCNLAGETHSFELPEGAIRPKLKDSGRDVYGCGLVMDPYDKLAIFFTLNGNLMGRQIPISPSVNEHLFPAVTFMCGVPSIEANFGDDKDKPFQYNIRNCHGIGLNYI